MTKIKPKRIVKHGCYSASNYDLGIRDRDGKLMKGEHDVFVIRGPDKNGFVKVKTITSLENTKTGTFHQSALYDVKKGKIVVIPDNLIKSNKLSGINRKPIWIHKTKLYKSNRKFRYPFIFSGIISKDTK